MEIFSELRNRLMERLDSMWESTDEEVMELIDSLIMEEGRRLRKSTEYLPASTCPSARAKDVLPTRPRGE